MKKAILSNHKRVTPLLLAGVMTCALPLTGCTNTKQPAAEPTQGTPATTAAEPLTKTTEPVVRTTDPEPTEAPTTQAHSTEAPTEPEVRSGITLNDPYNTFALEVLKRTADSTEDNVMVSPLSLMLALSMTANGANGDTAKEMLSVLGGDLTMEELNQLLDDYSASLPSTSEAKFSIANSIWYKDHPDVVIREDFLSKNQRYYSADIFPAPFDGSTIDAINDWVSGKTDGMINKLVNELTPDARMVLVNAILFDGQWEEQYYENQINRLTFTDARGNSKTVEQMCSEENYYLSGKNCTGFMKPYKGGKYAFVGLLPDAETTPEKLISNMTAESLKDLFANARRREVNVRIPMFTFDYTISMKEYLQTMGMNRAFLEDLSDFSGISEKERLYISDVIHKTRVEVTEKGTRAAAATAVIMDAVSCAMPEEPLNVFLDRPFVFMIVDTEQNLPIFIGRVNSIEEE